MSSTYQATTLGKLRKRAEKLGCDLIESTPTTLLIDIDTEAQQNVFESHVDILMPMFAKIENWISRNKRGTHYLIHLSTPATVYERIALQLALGSDPKRETLALLRLHEGKGEIIVLFKPKDGQQ